MGANGAVFSLVNGLCCDRRAGSTRPTNWCASTSFARASTGRWGSRSPISAILRDATGALVSSIGGHTYDFFGLALDGAPPRSVAGVGGGRRLLRDARRAARARTIVRQRRGRSPRPGDGGRARLLADRLAGDPQAIGRAVVLDGQTFTIGGVAPPGFVGTETLFAPDLWVPALAVDRLRAQLEERGSTPLRVTARLREGVERASSSRSGWRRCRPRSPPIIRRRTKAPCSTPCPTPTRASKRDWADR